MKRKLNFILLFITIILTAFQIDSFGQSIYRILDEENDALDCKLSILDQAQQEVILGYYIFEDDDEIGLTMLNALLAVAKRGVDVKILIDANKQFSKKTAQFLLENNIEVRVFNKRKAFYISTYINRYHDKLFIIDKKHLVTGGRNIKNAYYSLAKKNFEDREVYINDTAIVASVRAHFYSFWDNAKSTTPNRVSKIDDAYRNDISNKMKEADSLVSVHVLGRHKSSNYKFNWLDNIVPSDKSDKLSFFYTNLINYRHYAKRDDAVVDSINSLINGAQKTIYIDNPYFCPNKKQRKLFKNAVDRGVKIRVLTNSTGTSDVPLMQGVYLNMRRKLIKIGINLWEYDCNKMIHMKTMVIDDKISVISSFNWDRSSYQRNTEVAAVSYDADIALQHLAMMDKNLIDAVPILSNNRPAETRRTKFSSRLRAIVSRVTLSIILKPLL